MMNRSYCWCVVLLIVSLVACKHSESSSLVQGIQEESSRQASIECTCLFRQYGFTSVEACESGLLNPRVSYRCVVAALDETIDNERSKSDAGVSATLDSLEGYAMASKEMTSCLAGVDCDAGNGGWQQCASEFASTAGAESIQAVAVACKR